MDRTTPANVEAYIRSFPKPVEAKLRTVRRTIRAAVPKAEEKISYQIPAYMFHGRLVYFAAFKNHWSLFAPGGVRKKFKKQLAKYEGTGATIRFPLDEPVPVKLIRDIAKFRAKENLAKAGKG
jgi:uncharacterized protein YdhG (YjbR/CyaY superfamily)